MVIWQNNETNLKGHISGHTNPCDKCEVSFKPAELLRQHARKDHNDDVPNYVPNQNSDSPTTIICTMCDFRAKTSGQMKKHEGVRHSKLKSNVPCAFWLRGLCSMGQLCKFAHKRNICKFQSECTAWPNCAFEHTEWLIRKPCYYQQNCSNTYCKFEHFYEESYCGGLNPNGFLGINSHKEFPPLAPGIPAWGPWSN